MRPLIDRLRCPFNMGEQLSAEDVLAEMLEALVELERASLRMAQLYNRSSSKHEEKAPTIAEWDAGRQELDRARIKALSVIKRASVEA